MKQNSLVTVGIPTYNRPDGLKRILECVTTQSYSKLEIIISDNCSTDSRVMAVIENFSNKDSRIKSFRQIENIGGLDNFNFILGQASGEYFMWAADDDRVMSDYVENCLNLFSKNPNAVLATTSSQSVNIDNKSTSDLFNFMDTSTLNDYDKIKELLNYFSTTKAVTLFYSIFKTKYATMTCLNRYDSSDQGYLLKIAQYGDFAIDNSKIGYIYEYGSQQNNSASFDNIRRFIGFKSRINSHFLITGRLIGILKELISLKKISLVNRINLCNHYKNLFFKNPINKQMVLHEIKTFNAKQSIKAQIRLLLSMKRNEL